MNKISPKSIFTLRLVELLETEIEKRRQQLIDKLLLIKTKLNWFCREGEGENEGYISDCVHLHAWR